MKPKIRFSSSNILYEEKTLSEISTINPKTIVPLEFEYVDLESVSGTEMTSHRTEHKATAPSRAQRLAKKGDIFYQTVRPYQKNNYYFDMDDDNYVFSTGYAQIRPSIYGKYLFTLLQNDSFLKQVLDNCAGTSFPAINPSVLSRLSVRICTDKQEQQAIASYFTSLDSQISVSTSRLASLKQMKTASLQAMFPQEGETVPKIRFKGFEGEWKKVKLGDIAKFTKGQGYSKSDLKETGQPIILYGRMYTKYQFVIDEVDTFANLKDASILSEGDEIIMPASGETPEDIACASAVLAKDIILGGDLNIMHFDLTKISTPYIALVITYSKTHHDLSKCAQGKSVVHLHNGAISRATISLPSLAEQQAIASYFTSLDRQISLQSQRLEKLKQIKSACLDKMFV